MALILFGEVAMIAADPSIFQVLEGLGNALGFEVRREVEASESAWVDMVWFDNRFPVDKRIKMRYAPVLPVVAFEIELHTGLNAKHVKGSVSNLSTLGAQLGVIVIGNANITTLIKRPANQSANFEEVKKSLCDRVYRWVYAEAQPRGRIIVMFEDEVRSWADKVAHKALGKELLPQNR